MRNFDVLAAVLLVVGGLNWGLVGVIDFDLVAALFGADSILANAVYTLVGVAAVYQAIALKRIQRRGSVRTAAA
ncbi:MAG: hypothetical protein BroJett003_02570 [Planctomycetota bacterium]|nr:MAG: hypothetical protein BroJett003_02570 [Planctomycetota bacterium]